MARAAESRERRCGWVWLVVAVCLAAGIVGLRAQSQELVIDLLTAPNRFWNKTVVLKGHVRSVAANPPGTNRGSFVLRDPSDADITVITDELPAQGKQYTVTGIVEQSMPGDSVPFIRETARRLGTETLPPKAAEPPPVAAPPPAPAPRPRVATPEPARPSTSVAEAPRTAVPVTPAAVPDAASTSITTSTLALYGLIALVAVLGVTVAIMLRPRRPTPGPAQVVAHQAQPVPPPMAVRPPVVPVSARASVDPAATRFIPPGSPLAAGLPGADATQVHMDLGAELVVVDGPDKGRRFGLTKPQVAIGRSGGRLNDVALTDETVSRDHARIVYSAPDQRFVLLNETPVNPAKVNGVVVDSATLTENDVIQLGATSLRFRRAPR